MSIWNLKKFLGKSKLQGLNTPPPLFMGRKKVRVRRGKGKEGRDWARKEVGWERETAEEVINQSMRFLRWLKL
jgi:hypothetical protein